MVPRAFTNETWLASLLWRWVRKGYVPNVTLIDDPDAIPIRFNDSESPVAIITTTDGREYVFTSTRVVEGDTLLWYADVVRCHWITDSPDPWEAARLKRTHSHRLILELVDGQRLVIEQLGHAVFPLLKFFDSIAGQELD